jgi:capsule polysaccharide modification protein KpsS
MSEHESPEAATQVSPYLLRPTRTYEEYLRDRAIAERVQKQSQHSVAFSVIDNTQTRSTKLDTTA